MISQSKPLLSLEFGLALTAVLTFILVQDGYRSVLFGYWPEFGPKFSPSASFRPVCPQIGIRIAFASSVLITSKFLNFAMHHKPGTRKAMPSSERPLQPVVRKACCCTESLSCNLNLPIFRTSLCSAVRDGPWQFKRTAKPQSEGLAPKTLLAPKTFPHVASTAAVLCDSQHLCQYWSR